MFKCSVAASVLLLCACSSSSSPAGAQGGSDAGGGSDAAAAAFVGTWSCHGTAPLVVTAPPVFAGTYKPSSDAYLLAISANPDGTLTARVEQLDGGILCTKKAIVSGSKADFTGQTCPVSVESTTVTETFTSGTFTVSGNTLTDVGLGTLAGMIPVDGGTAELAATTKFDEACTK